MLTFARGSNVVQFMKGVYCTYPCHQNSKSIFKLQDPENKDFLITKSLGDFMLFPCLFRLSNDTYFIRNEQNYQNLSIDNVGHFVT
jgi:hypothetical protein